MAKYDQGGGCPCGLYRYCDEGCQNFRTHGMPSAIAMVERQEAKRNRELRRGNALIVMNIKEQGE